MASERTHKIRGTRIDSGRLLRRYWLEAADAECETLQFADLEQGERFIFLPIPGDNHGHGGLLNGAWLFMKIEPRFTPAGGTEYFNAIRLVDGCKIHFSETDRVYVVW